MNIRLLTVSIAAAVSLPVAAFAQTDGASVTREEVRKELAQLERAGYQPGRNNPHYPDDLLAAQARIYAAAGTNIYAVNAVGGATYGLTTSGSRDGAKVSQTALFAHH
ncbi:DUF4148 domain-containing protein [Paraburkholderia caribensis]|uniref:DUF4148 domain-containing protein n=1 Tax=Paraburkholderia caribensis TaxID=75105 RepID=UPI0034D2AF44